MGAVVVAIWGSALLSGLLPQDGISWQGHLFGAIGGVVAAARAAARPRVIVLLAPSEGKTPPPAGRPARRPRRPGLPGARRAARRRSSTASSASRPARDRRALAALGLSTAQAGELPATPTC